MEAAVGSDAISVSAAVNLTNTLLAGYTLKIMGEVSELSDKPSYKAVYFTIKDERASLKCLMWKPQYRASGLKLKLGDNVEVVGKFNIYASKGNLNFQVSSICLTGEGLLRQQVAQLAEKLRQEGLMEASRKRPIPEFPMQVGLVTSPAGAAVRDVLRTLKRRFPFADVLFAGVQVEGKQAPANLIAAINTVVAGGAEVVLLVRGGGSYEDLMPFNDEALARTIAACPVPVITGIGHEPDTSIADLVADKRASTPTAAAEAASPDTGELNRSFDTLQKRMFDRFHHRFSRSNEILDSIASRPIFKDPMQLLAADMQGLDRATEAFERFSTTMLNRFENEVSLMSARPMLADPALLLTAYKQGLEKDTEAMKRLSTGMFDRYESEAALMAARLNDLSPLTLLSRGWAIARDARGNVVSKVGQSVVGDTLDVRVSDGVLSCIVEGSTQDKLVKEIEWRQ